MPDIRDRDAPARGMDREDRRADEFDRRPIDEPAMRSREGAAFNLRERERDESIPDLIRRLTDQGSHLAHQQAELIQAEVRSAINDMKEAVGAMAGAAVLGIAGLGVLLMGISFLLGEVMELWLATLIVAVATLAGAYAMFSGGQKKLHSSSMSAERSRRTIERAPSAITGHRHEGMNDGR